MLQRWRAVEGPDAAQKCFAPAAIMMAMEGLSYLHNGVHARLLASNAAAAQRTEDAAVAGARCCLRMVRAAEAWQGEQAAKQREGACHSAMVALLAYLKALSSHGAAFSCEAACCHSGPCIPGKQAVAAVIEAVHLASEVLQTVAGMPSMHGVCWPGKSQADGSMTAAICLSALHIGCDFVQQKLPGRRVRLARCIEGEQVEPMVRALMGLLCAQVRQRAACPCSGVHEVAWQCVCARLEAPAVVQRH